MQSAYGLRFKSLGPFRLGSEFRVWGSGLSLGSRV